MLPKMDVMLALICPILERISLPYTESSQRLVGMSMGSGGSWQTRIETGSIDKVSTLPKIVCQPIHPFLPVVLFQLPHQSSWTVAQCPVSKQPNDTDVTSIPEKHIVAVIICMFIREGNFSCLSLHNKHPLDYFTHLRVRISRNIFWCGRSSWSRTVWLVDR